MCSAATPHQPLPEAVETEVAQTEAAEQEQQAETCPCCGESDLNYGDSGLVDSQYYYNWVCGECGATGTEWFDLVFSEHIIKKPGRVPEAE